MSYFVIIFCYEWIISQCWILWCVWQSGTFDCWTFFVVCHPLIWWIDSIEIISYFVIIFCYEWIISQCWILWIIWQSSLSGTFDCWTFFDVLSFNLVNGQFLDYVILCDYLCCATNDQFLYFYFLLCENVWN